MNRIFSTVGDRLLDRADKLIVTMARYQGLVVEAKFELSGTIEAEMDDDCNVSQPVDCRLINDLLSRFQEGGPK